MIHGRFWTLIAVWVPVVALYLAAVGSSAAAVRRLDDAGRGAHAAQHIYHRWTAGLRLAAVGLFAAGLFLTDWDPMVRSLSWVTAVPGAADLVLLTPFLAAAVLIFVGHCRIDCALHQVILDGPDWRDQPHAEVWTLGQYLNFNLRHHLLVVAVPMAVILAAFDLSRVYEQRLNEISRVAWAGEVAPGIAAAAVFLLAPLMLRYLWPTQPMPAGPLRDRLQLICRRLGLRYRDILIWRSGGMMINAAVMGIFGRVRYVMLSDGLLEAMNDAQIEAVFGHEAGHVRHRHIPFFVLFAVCSMLFLSGVIEALRLGVEREMFRLSTPAIQGIGGACVLVFWGLGFGWISRRFERQADLCGARCVTPTLPEQCSLPCAVHDHDAVADPDQTDGPVCSTAAAVFTSALDRVAVLNGIPPEERSWRHSSIASRVRFLTSLSGDPGRIRRFERQVRRIKAALLLLGLGGSLVAGAYVWDHPLYGIDRLPRINAETQKR
ncbi:MAG: M48 family metalloprotease [Planctomycetes bacterium]|nr:M48 family metalloprotease [Planctomycetota bacterium]